MAGSPAALLRPGPLRTVRAGRPRTRLKQAEVKIRCRRRRTSPSTRCQLIDSHARASPSGPFTPAAAEASNVPFGSRVATPCPFTDPRGRPFGPGHQAPYPASSRQAAAGRSGHGACRSCHLSVRRHWLVGSSCARWGCAPSSRSAYRARLGPHRGCHVARARDPTGMGALYTPGVRCPHGRHRQSGRRWPPPSGPPLDPGAASTFPGLGITERRQGFTRVHPSGLPRCR